MFDIETLVSVDDLQDTEALQRYRDTLDAGAKAHHKGARYLKETLEPYIIKQKQPDGSIKGLPETIETRKWRVLRRYYS